VDWRSLESQQVRFEELLKLVDWGSAPSLIDYGCGYGALARQLIDEGREFTYTGFDLAESMIGAARKLIDDPRCRFTTSQAELAPADYTLASGIFNVKLATDDATWHEYVVEVLDSLAAHSERGFAFNMLTRHADPPLMRVDLYYADPARYFRLCAERYSRSIALLHDYALFEFTILVRLGSSPKPLAT
jgi:SAM-dependent methyltransferase